MEIRYLGPLAVAASGRTIALGGPRQRLVLSHLLIASGETVSVDRLIELVWGERSPPSARATLQTYVSHLRKALGADRIDGHGQGYTLRAAPAEIDARQFGGLAEQGRSLLEQEPHEAQRLLGEALTLWRGPPFADLAGEPSLQGEVTRLEELRLSVLEDRVAAGLALGRHDLLVGELETLVAANPLRERLWEQLVVALYRCGRQSEALAAYDRLRKLLAEELGIDPSPDLRRVHEQVLRQDPALAPPLRSAVATNLPRSRTRFVGRRRDLDELSGMLGQYRLVTLTGPGGAGKTRLAVEVAGGLLDRFADGVFFVDLAPLPGGALIAAEVFRAIGLALGGGGLTGEQPAVEDVVRFLGARQALLVLDNCEHLVADAAAFVDRVLAVGDDAVIVVTSREPLMVDGEHVWPVGSLSVPDDVATEGEQDSEALQLLVDRLRAARPRLDLTDADRRALVRICQQLDGMPLALELAAARMAQLAPDDVAERLADRFALLVGGRQRPERQQTLQAAVDWSHDLLDPAEQTVLRRLAVFAGSFTLTEVEAVCADGLAEPTARPFASLVAKSLVQTEQHPGVLRYRLLETIRLYAHDKLVVAGEEAAARRRHRDWYLAWVESFPTDQAFMSQSVADALETEHDNLRRALEWSRQEARHDLVARLALGATGLFVFNGHAAEGDGWMQLAVEAPDLPAALAAQVRIAIGFSQGWRWTGDVTLWSDIVDGFPELGAALPDDHPARALAWIMMSAGHTALSREPARIEHCADEAIACSRRAGAPLFEAFGLLMKARARMYARDYAGAVTVLERATQVPGWSVEHDPAVTSMDLGIARHLVGDFAAALEAVAPIVSRRSSVWRHLGLVVAAIATAGLGQQPRSAGLLGEAVTAVREGRWHHPLATYDCLVGYAVLAAHRGDSETTARLLTTVQGRLSFPGLYVVARHYRELARATVAADVWDRCVAEGREVDAHAALEEAADAAAV